MPALEQLIGDINRKKLWLGDEAVAAMQHYAHRLLQLLDAHLGENQEKIAACADACGKALEALVRFRKLATGETVDQRG